MQLEFRRTGNSKNSGGQVSDYSWISSEMASDLSGNFGELASVYT